MDISHRRKIENLLSGVILWNTLSILSSNEDLNKHEIVNSILQT